MPKTDHNAATGSAVDLIDFSSTELSVTVTDPTEKLRTARMVQNGTDNQRGQWSTDQPIKLVSPRFSSSSQVNRHLSTNSTHQHGQTYETTVIKEPPQSPPPLVPANNQGQWQEPLALPPQPPPLPPPYRDPPPAPASVRQPFVPAAIVSKADLLAEIRLRGGFQGAGLQRVENNTRYLALHCHNVC